MKVNDTGECHVTAECGWSSNPDMDRHVCLEFQHTDVNISPRFLALLRLHRRKGEKKFGAHTQGSYPGPEQCSLAWIIVNEFVDSL
jgi:hypothetical protein